MGGRGPLSAIMGSTPSVLVRSSARPTDTCTYKCNRGGSEARKSLSAMMGPHKWKTMLSSKEAQLANEGNHFRFRDALLVSMH